MIDFIRLTQTPNGVVTLTFNRPAAYNAFNWAAMHQFSASVAQLSQDPTLRVLILTGAEPSAFCSGADIAEFSAYASPEDGAAMSQLMGDTLLQLERLPVPVIGAINGYALGGGSEIALACDLRIVDEAVRFGMVQMRMGVTPGWGAGQRLLRVVGYAKALEILLRAEQLHAADLLALGLTNQVVETGQALPHALAFAEQIAQSPPEVVRSIKTLLQAGITQPYDKALQIEREQFPPLWAGDAHLQAVEKFLQSKK